MLRPRLRLPRFGLARPNLRRCIHYVPPLTHDQVFTAQGVPGLLSPQAYEMAWRQYMTLMMEKLNALTAGTEYEQREVKSILLSTARNPAEAPIFNHASMAHNNHFFFKRLAPAPVAMPDPLRLALEQSFSSVETLRREFVVTASAMFGPGFVWLVKLHGRDAVGQSASPFRILPTYLAGSPYPGAHWRRQGTDYNTVAAGGEGGATLGAPPPPGSRPPRVPKKPGDEKGPPPGGIEIIPLLCLNTWEHVWLMDYGFGVGGYGGKTAFVERWWDSIDWEAVAIDANVDRLAYKY